MMGDLDCRIERYAYLQEKVTAGEISRAFKLSKKEAKRRLESLVRQGYIKWDFLPSRMKKAGQIM